MDSTPSPDQIRKWTADYLAGTISEEDKQQLEAWYQAMPDAPVEWSDPQVTAAGHLQKKLLQNIHRDIRRQEWRQQHRQRARAIRIAAILAVLLGAGLFFFLQPHRQPHAIAQLPVKQDIQPGSTAATLLLADGKEVKLDSTHAVNVTTQQGRVCLVNQQGNTTYMGRLADENASNTLLTHRGEQAPPVTLPDGTKVWMNAASSLRFPARFNGGTREVTLSGEAYFEVAKNAMQPFIVNTGASKVEVLGTHFDVMAYPDEPHTRATLMEGAIRLRNARSSVKLVPGQQAIAAASQEISISNVDPMQSVAWMYGQLSMRYMDLPAFMRSVSRWYDVDIRFEGNTTAISFSGSLDKSIPLSQLLTALNANGVHCRLEGRTVIVSNQ